MSVFIPTRKSARGHPLCGWTWHRSVEGSKGIIPCGSAAGKRERLASTFQVHYACSGVNTFYFVLQWDTRYKILYHFLGLK